MSVQSKKNSSGICRHHSAFEMFNLKSCFSSLLMVTSIIALLSWQHKGQQVIINVVLKTKCPNPKTWVIFPMAASSHKHCLIPEVDSQKLHLQILLPRICSLRALMHLSLQLVFCVCLFTVSKQLSKPIWRFNPLSKMFMCNTGRGNEDESGIVGISNNKPQPCAFYKLYMTAL